MTKIRESTGSPPRLTLSPATKFVPLTVTVVPPLTVPSAGLTPEIEGGSSTTVALTVGDMLCVPVGVAVRVKLKVDEGVQVKLTGAGVVVAVRVLVAV